MNRIALGLVGIQAALARTWDCWVIKKLWFTFWGTSVLCPTAAVPVCIPIGGAQELRFLHVLCRALTGLGLFKKVLIYVLGCSRAQALPP